MLAGIEPTAVSEVTSIEDDPVPLMDDEPEELEAMPHPRLAVAFPPTLIPLVELRPSAKTQYVPVETIFAVASTLMVGGVLRNMLEKASFWTEESFTRIAAASPVKPPELGGYSTTTELDSATLFIALISCLAAVT